MRELDRDADRELVRELFRELRAEVRSLFKAESNTEMSSSLSPPPPRSSRSFFIAGHITVRGYVRAYVCGDLSRPKEKRNTFFWFFGCLRVGSQKKNQSFVSDAKIPRSIFVTTFADVSDTKRANL